MTVPTHVALVMLAYALALAAACGDSGEKDRMPTEALAPGPLVVYTTEVRYAETPERRWPTLAVVAHDLAAQRETSRFEVGGVDEYPGQIVLSGSTMFVGLEKRIVAFNLDGSGERTLLEAPAREGSYVGDILPSPDGTRVAVSVTANETNGDQHVARVDLTILDVATGSRTATFPTDSFYSHPVAWLADGGSLLLGPPQGSAAFALLRLDGTSRLHANPNGA